MNIVIYMMMVAAGGLGCLHELLYDRTNRWLLGSTGLLFVLAVCSRIGYGYDYSDLTHYINYFLEDNDAYFEPGYVFVTDIIKQTVGYYPTALVTFIAIWILLTALASDFICSRFNTTDHQEFQYYPSTFIFLLILYWGCCFACEGLRSGLAIPLLFCASALLINEKFWAALLISALAVLFHYSAAIFILGIAVLAVMKTLDRNGYLYWFLTLIGLDLFMGFVHTVEIPFISQFFSMVGEFEELAHFDKYSEEVAESYFSTQYVTYHLFGLLMLWGDLEDRKYNRAVMLYYIGLSLGTLFQSTIIVMRIQWLYLPMVGFVIYYYLRNSCRLPQEKYAVVVSYGLIQSVMVLRYLGWHI